MTPTALDRFLNELLDVLRQLFVGGLACPDRELPEDLVALAERARELGLASGADHLLGLSRHLGALAAEQGGAAGDGDGRGEETESAWDDTQRLLAWLRLLRTERDLMAVETHLSERPATDAAAPGGRPDRGPTLSLTVWPVGLELERQGRLVIHALASHSGARRRHVLLLDELTDVDPDDPIHSRAISRLFQDTVRLASVMASPIRLEDHPALERAGALVVQPAFQTRPLTQVTAESPPLEPPRLDGDAGAALEGEEWPAGPFQLTALLRRTRERTRIERPDGTPLPVSTSELLRFNLDKLLVREGRPHCALDLTLVRRRARLSLVAARTDFDGRTFPAANPAAFRLDGQALFLRAVSQPDTTSSLEGLWLTTAALLVAGRGLAHRRESIEGVRAALARLSPEGVLERYRARLTGFFLGHSSLRQPGSGAAHRTGSHEALDPSTQALVRDALALFSAPESAADLQTLARVLGQPVDATSPADRRHLDAPLLYATLWLAREDDSADSSTPSEASQGSGSSEMLADLWQAVAAKWAWSPLEDPTPAEICARALLLARVGSNPAETEPSSEADPLTAARRFLDAHLEVWRTSGGNRQTPMPSLLELIQLGDTWARLHDGQIDGPAVEALRLPTVRVRRMCLDALLDWSLSIQDPPTPPQRWAAADALAVIATANLRSVVSRQ